MSFGTVKARVFRSAPAALGRAKRARTESSAVVRRHRGFGHGGPVGKRALAAGFTYIGLLVLIAMMGIALVVVSEVWQTAQKREKEQELLFVGNQFRRAIAMYRTNGSGYPHQLEDLLKDPGFPGVRRYLRKIYRDPITGGVEWGLVKPDGNSIVGVYSLSDAEPLKQTGFSVADQSFEAKKKYSEWVFVSGRIQGGAPASKTPVPAAAQAPGALTAPPAAQASADTTTPAGSGTTTPADSGIPPFDQGQLGPDRSGPPVRR